MKKNSLAEIVNQVTRGENKEISGKETEKLKKMLKSLNKNIYHLNVYNVKYLKTKKNYKNVSS